VVLDGTIPGGSHGEILDAIGRIRDDARVIVSSGFSEEELRGQLGSARRFSFLQKPFRFAELRAKIDEVVAST
jgi:DNA-binding NtrC family response regulator